MDTEADTEARVVRYGSVCSGIEAASVAWEPLGWVPAFFAEVEPFCCALLAERYPNVPNLGDITAADFLERAAACGPIDVLVGGTPCQSFSIAGLRGGMNDARGNLTLRFVEIADAIRPVHVIWENVPGVFSDKTNGFGCLLGALIGADSPLVPAKGQRWTRAGVADGPVRSAAWRVLDAQYFGLAQRRERVFVMASPRNGTHPAEILFEREGLRRHPPTRGEAGQDVAGTLSARAKGGGGLGTDFDIGGGSYQLSPSLTASGRGTERAGDSRGQDCVIPILEPGARTGKSTDDIRAGIGIGEPGDPMFTLQSGKQHGVAVELSNGDISHCLNAGGMGRIDYETETLVTHALTGEGFDASEDETGRGTPLVPWMFQGMRIQDIDGVADTVTNNPNGGTRINPVLAPMAFSCKDSGGDASDVSPTPLKAESGQTGKGDSAPCVMIESGALAVRRLLPVECARLQGFPDDYLDITYRGKPAADGNKYRALGNSFAVPVVRWIGQQIQRVAGNVKQ